MGDADTVDARRSHALGPQNALGETLEGRQTRRDASELCQRARGLGDCGVGLLPERKRARGDGRGDEGRVRAAVLGRARCIGCRVRRGDGAEMLAERVDGLVSFVAESVDICKLLP